MVNFSDTNNGREVRFSFNYFRRAHYTPTHVGAHQLSVWWDGVALPESPFRVQVETQTTVHSDASKVTCSGEGLAGGVVGTEIRAFIDTRRGKSLENRYDT